MAVFADIDDLKTMHSKHVPIHNIKARGEILYFVLVVW
jgi:hypothetical protein